MSDAVKDTEYAGKLMMSINTVSKEFKCRNEESAEGMFLIRYVLRNENS